MHVWCQLSDRSQNSKIPGFFLFAISGCNWCPGNWMPVSNMNIVPLVSQLSLCHCLIAVSSLCAFMRTTYFTCHKMAPRSFPHEEFLCGSNATVFICAQGAGMRKLLCGCLIYCRFCVFIKMLSIVLARAICCSMGNQLGFFLTSSLVLHAFIL